MKAARILHLGPPDAIVIQDLPVPVPGPGQLLVRVRAAGVGPWDALVREGTSKIDQPLPLILGSELAGIVESAGPGVSGFQPGNDIYGATNEQFTGAYTEFALASAKMVAQKPKSLTYIEAASVPVVAVTAWEMLFDYARVTAGQSVLILGAAGNVGAYAVQLAQFTGLQVFATAGPGDLEYVRSLGAQTVLDYKTTKFEEVLSPVDVVIDTVGRDARDRSVRLLKPGGILVSVVSPIPDAIRARSDIRSAFFIVEVTTARLNALTELFDSGKLLTHVGTVLPLAEARTAHEMLAGAPHKRGKIVLKVGD